MAFVTTWNQPRGVSKLRGGHGIETRTATLSLLWFLTKSTSVEVIPAPTIIFPTNELVWKKLRMLNSESMNSGVETAAEKIKACQFLVLEVQERGDDLRESPSRSVTVLLSTYIKMP